MSRRSESVLLDARALPAGRSGWSLGDEVSHRERKAGVKSPGPVVIRSKAADVRAASVVALANGGEVVPHPLFPDAPQVVAWDVAGWCEKPVFVRRVGEGHFYGEQDEKGNVTSRSWRRGDRDLWEPMRTLEQLVPCRKCKACRRAKSRHWAKRCVLEWMQSFRTWFGTLTFGQDERYRVDTLLRARLSAAGVSFDALSDREKFELRCDELWPRLLAFLKGLRKRRGARAPVDLRYFVAVEPHKEDAFPHFHILIHECREHSGFGERQLRGEWRDWQQRPKGGRLPAKLGFVEFTLVKTAERAKYAAKYVGKFDFGRVRCSLRYGKRMVPLQVVSVAGGVPEPLASLAEG